MHVGLAIKNKRTAQMDVISEINIYVTLQPNMSTQVWISMGIICDVTRFQLYDSAFTIFFRRICSRNHGFTYLKRLNNAGSGFDPTSYRQPFSDALPVALSKTVCLVMQYILILCDSKVIQISVQIIITKYPITITILRDYL